MEKIYDNSLVTIATTIANLANNYIYSKTEREKIQAQERLIRYVTEVGVQVIDKILRVIYTERAIAIEKIIEVLDNGIRNNDKELMIQAMDNLTQIIIRSPINLNRLLNS